MIRLVAALVIMLPLPAVAEEFTGKVVGITDGDTIKVLRNGEEVKIRLEGIDCPESHQAFGNKAKQATSELAFGKAVTVQAKFRSLTNLPKSMPDRRSNSCFPIRWYAALPPVWQPLQSGTQEKSEAFCDIPPSKPVWAASTCQ